MSTDFIAAQSQSAEQPEDSENADLALFLGERLEKSKEDRLDAEDFLKEIGMGHFAERGRLEAHSAVLKVGWGGQTT